MMEEHHCCLCRFWSSLSVWGRKQGVKKAGDKFAFLPEKTGMVDREIVAQKQLVREGARQK